MIALSFFVIITIQYIRKGISLNHLQRVIDILYNKYIFIKDRVENRLSDVVKLGITKNLGIVKFCFG